MLPQNFPTHNTKLISSYSNPVIKGSEGIKYVSSTNHRILINTPYCENETRLESAVTSNEDTLPQLTNKFKRKRKGQHSHSVSDLTLLIHSHDAVDLDTLSHDDLLSVYVKERKQRLRQKKQYIRLGQQFEQTLTKKADDYEDELQQTEDDIKLEYETKLIEAEIKRNESDTKITQLMQEVQRLKSLLEIKKFPSPNETVPIYSTSLSELQPATARANVAANSTTGSINYPVLVSRNDSSSNIAAQMATDFSFSVLPGTIAQRQIMDEGMTERMRINLKKKMHLEPFAKSDTDNDDRSFIDSESETPPPRRRRRKKKNKKRQKEPSLWDTFLLCLTPSVCE